MADLVGHASTTSVKSQFTTDRFGNANDAILVNSLASSWKLADNVFLWGNYTLMVWVKNLDCKGANHIGLLFPYLLSFWYITGNLLLKSDAWRRHCHCQLINIAWQQMLQFLAKSEQTKTVHVKYIEHVVSLGHGAEWYHRAHLRQRSLDSRGHIHSADKYCQIGMQHRLFPVKSGHCGNFFLNRNKEEKQNQKVYWTF